MTVIVNCQKATVLSDINFEHDTQATSGSTTGDWFINFCDQVDKDCRSIQPLWDELAGELRGRVTVASCDKYYNQFIRGKFYQYDGDLDPEKLKQFATQDYFSANHQGEIPQEASTFQKLWQILLVEIEENGGLLNTLLMKDSEGNINYQALTIIVGIPFCTLIGVCLILSFKGDEVEDQSVEESSTSAQPKKEKQQSQEEKRDSIKPYEQIQSKVAGGYLTQGREHMTSIGNFSQNLIYLESSAAKRSPQVSAKMSVLAGRNYEDVDQSDKKNVMGDQTTVNVDYMPQNLQSTPQIGKVMLGSTLPKASQNIDSKQITNQFIESTHGSPNKDNSGRKLSSIKSQERMRSPVSNSSGGRSTRKRSYSTDPDSDERAFVYPCQAFKQFLLSMKEGNINLAEIASQPQVAEFLTSSERQKPKTFQQTLRSPSNSSQNLRNSKSKPRSKAHSLSKKKTPGVIHEDDEEQNPNNRDSLLNPLDKNRSKKRPVTDKRDNSSSAQKRPKSALDNSLGAWSKGHAGDKRAPNQDSYSSSMSQPYSKNGSTPFESFNKPSKSPGGQHSKNNEPKDKIGLYQQIDLEEDQDDQIAKDQKNGNNKQGHENPNKRRQDLTNIADQSKRVLSRNKDEENLERQMKQSSRKEESKQSIKDLSSINEDNYENQRQNLSSNSGIQGIIPTGNFGEEKEILINKDPNSYGSSMIMSPNVSNDEVNHEQFGKPFQRPNIPRINLGQGLPLYEDEDEMDNTQQDYDTEAPNFNLNKNSQASKQRRPRNERLSISNRIDQKSKSESPEDKKSNQNRSREGSRFDKKGKPISRDGSSSLGKRDKVSSLIKDDSIQQVETKSKNRSGSNSGSIHESPVRDQKSINSSIGKKEKVLAQGCSIQKINASQQSPFRKQGKGTNQSNSKDTKKNKDLGLQPLEKQDKSFNSAFTDSINQRGSSLNDSHYKSKGVSKDRTSLPTVNELKQAAVKDPKMKELESQTKKEQIKQQELEKEKERQKKLKQEQLEQDKQKQIRRERLKEEQLKKARDRRTSLYNNDQSPKKLSNSRSPPKSSNYLGTSPNPSQVQSNAIQKPISQDIGKEGLNKGIIEKQALSSQSKSRGHSRDPSKGRVGSLIDNTLNQMLEKSFDHIYNDKPFDKSFDISQIPKRDAPSKRSDDLNDREELKDLFERANSILNQSQISNINLMDQDNDNSRLSNLQKAPNDRPTFKDLLDQQKQSQVIYRQDQDKVDDTKESKLMEILKQSTIDQIEKEKESPYKKDSLYDRQSNDKSFDSSQKNNSPVQTFQVKKKYGTNSGMRESPFKVKNTPCEEEKKQNQSMNLIPEQKKEQEMAVSSNEGKSEKYRRNRIDRKYGQDSNQIEYQSPNEPLPNRQVPTPLLPSQLQKSIQDRSSIEKFNKSLKEENTDFAKKPNTEPSDEDSQNLRNTTSKVKTSTHPKQQYKQYKEDEREEAKASTYGYDLPSDDEARNQGIPLRGSQHMSGISSSVKKQDKRDQRKQEVEGQFNQEYQEQVLVSYNSEADNKAPTKEYLRASLQGRFKNNEEESKGTRSRDNTPHQSSIRREKRQQIKEADAHKESEPTFISNNEQQLSNTDQEQQYYFQSKENSKEEGQEEIQFYGRISINQYTYQEQKRTVEQVERRGQKQRPIFQSFGEDNIHQSGSDKQNKDKDEKINVLIYQEDNENRKVFSNQDILDQRLKDRIMTDPSKPIDYNLLREILQEVQNTKESSVGEKENKKKIEIEIEKNKDQNKYHRKGKKSIGIDADYPVFHGNLVDRKVQTDEVKALKMYDMLDGEKFKKFFFAVFYTYMMLNTMMAEGMPDQKK